MNAHTQKDKVRRRRTRKLPEQVRFVPKTKADLADYLEQPARYGYETFAAFARDLFDAVKNADPRSGVVRFRHKYAEEMRQGQAA